MNNNAKYNIEFNQIEMEMKVIPRGEIPRTIRCDPAYTYFKPRSVPLSEIEDEIAITLEELEALRLTDMEGLSQKEAGKKMGISQSTVSRHLDIAHHKLAKVLVHGLAIRIANAADFFHCDSCGHTWLIPEDLTSVQQCEKCGSSKFHPHVHSNNELDSNFTKKTT
ncbi:MAG: DUF134 domain-containing protein [Candidatus Hodarchaeota archaeon]